MFGVVILGCKLRFEAVGLVLPAGQTVTKLAAVGLTAVTVNATAPASVGTPARPLTVTLVIDPVATGPVPWDWPSMVVAPGLVSSKRAGINP